MIEGVYHSIKNENNLHNLMKGRALSELGVTRTVAGKWRKSPRHPRDLLQIRRNQSRKVEAMVFICAITNVGKPEHQGPRTSETIVVSHVHRSKEYSVSLISESVPLCLFGV